MPARPTTSRLLALVCAGAATLSVAACGSSAGSALTPIAERSSGSPVDAASSVSTSPTLVQSPSETPPTTPVSLSPSASPTPVPPTPTPLTAATGWADRNYPSGCLGGATVKLSGGTASGGGATVRGSVALVDDVTKDGLTDVVVRLTCTAADGRVHDELVVHSGYRGGVSQIGVVLTTGDDQTLQAVKKYQGGMVVGAYAWSDGADRAGTPNTLVTTVWAFDGSTMKRQSRYTDPVGVLQPEGN